MKSRFYIPWAFALAALLAAACPAFAAGLPPAPIRPVTNLYHGVTVVDNYRWLENFNDPEVKQWSAAQNALTRDYLDHLPVRSNIVKRLKKIYAKTSASYSGIAIPPRPPLRHEIPAARPAALAHHPQVARRSLLRAGRA